MNSPCCDKTLAPCLTVKGIVKKWGCACGNTYSKYTLKKRGVM